ncbi:MAG: amidohydrolase, partial [Gemmatimonadota bacterium]
TALEFFLNPKLVEDAWAYFRDVQTKDIKYTPFITANDPPPIWLNERTMAEYREKLRPFYYDETKYDTYLEQLGIKYPTLRTETAAQGKDATRSGN